MNVIAFYISRQAAGLILVQYFSEREPYLLLAQTVALVFRKLIESMQHGNDVHGYFVI